jgi:acyl transferase domain-containing protein
VVGLIRASLAVFHGVLPPNLGFGRINPQIDLEHSPFYVPTTSGHGRKGGGDWPVSAVSGSAGPTRMSSLVLHPRRRKGSRKRCRC